MSSKSNACTSSDFSKLPHLLEDYCPGMKNVQIEQNKNDINQSGKGHKGGQGPAEKTKTFKGDCFFWPDPDCFEQNVVPVAHFYS